MRRSWAVARSITLWVACGACGPAIPPLPAQGGPAWRELTSPHITLCTDASADRAHEIVSDAEHLRQVLIGTVFQTVAREGRIIMIALRDLDEYHAYASDRSGGRMHFASNNLLYQPLIVLPADTPLSSGARTEAHELCHVLAYALITRQPRWFAEGLAEYFETIKLDESAGTVELGREPTYQGRPTRIHHLISLPTMFACTGAACTNPAFYATAWALFTYLQNAHTAELAQFEQRLAANHDWKAAWSEAFPGLSINALESDLRVWLTSGSHRLLRYNVKLSDFPVSVRILGEADIHAIRGLLAPTPEAELVEVEAARRIEPTNVLANLLAHVHGHPVTFDAARAIAAAHPDDWHAWRLVVSTASTRDDAAPARDTACL